MSADSSTAISIEQIRRGVVPCGREGQRVSPYRMALGPGWNRRLADDPTESRCGRGLIDGVGI